MDLKDVLKMLRKEHHISQAKLAQFLGYGETAISNYEAGRNEPSIQDLKKIAQFFDVSLDYLTGLTSEKHPYMEAYESQLYYKLQNKLENISTEQQQLIQEDLLLYIDFTIYMLSKSKNQ